MREIFAIMRVLFLIYIVSVIVVIMWGEGEKKLKTHVSLRKMSGVSKTKITRYNTVDLGREEYEQTPSDGHLIQLR
jgi:hypothetical protein